MPKHLLKVGDIVCFRVHPYASNVTSIIISGEPLQTPPLMIISEIFRKRESVNAAWEDDSTEILYKCVWYSSKLNRFQIDWLKSDLVKLISSVEILTSVSPGQLVALTTIYTELGKRKSSLSSSDDIDVQALTSITPLLNFLPPVMQVISVHDHEVKKHEPLGSETSVKQRLISKSDVKCIWFNPDGDKFSEVTLPIESLQIIAEIVPNVLQDLNNAIESNLYYVIEGRLVRPKNVTARSGQYFLRATDLVLNTTIEIPVHNKIVINKCNPFRNQAPKFDTDTSVMAEAIKEEMIALIKGSVNNSSFLRLQYKNKNDRITLRTLKNYSLQEFEENGKKIILLTGYCFLRKEQRSFRLERIQNLQELNLSFKSE